MIHSAIIGFNQWRRDLCIVLEKDCCVEETNYAPYEHEIANIQSQ